MTDIEIARNVELEKIAKKSCVLSGNPLQC